SGPGESLPVQLDGQGHPLLNAEVTPLGGTPLQGKFVLDIGSGGGLSLHSPFVTEHKFLSSGLKTIRSIGAGGAGGQSVGQIGRVSELKIGKFRIANPTALFSEDKAGAFANDTLAGNIGQRVAGKFRLFLDYNHERIIFEPAANFSEPFDRAFSGLALIGEDKDYSTFRITEVLEGSPAAEVGLQQDDLIIKVDDKHASELTLTKLSEMFEQPVAYKLAIRRGDKTLQVILTPRKLV
ncbi:MAG: PDZ domain-containing protein, partial [Pyrinomonadaceae bacterium]